MNGKLTLDYRCDNPGRHHDSRDYHDHRIRSHHRRRHHLVRAAALVHLQNYCCSHLNWSFHRLLNAVARIGPGHPMNYNSRLNLGPSPDQQSEISKIKTNYNFYQIIFDSF